MATLEEIVSWQLGRWPEIDFEVALQCSYGWPAVLKNAVVTRSGGPNPNLYYLCCPFLRRKLAVLEDSGAMKGYIKMIQSDAALGAAVIEAQNRHAQEWVEAGGRLAQVKSAAIAGARRSLALKCLHAHYAWYLLHPDYRLGMVMAAEIGEQWCPDERCRTAAGENAGEGKG